MPKTFGKDLAEFGGVLKVKVIKITNFCDQAGFMDKTDPFVELEMGEEKYKTVTKNNAGAYTRYAMPPGGNAVYDEDFAFNKQCLRHPALTSVIPLQEGEQTMKVKVWDSDTLSNDLLGQRDIDLDDESVNNGSFDLVLKGKVTGQVYLHFSYN